MANKAPAPAFGIGLFFGFLLGVIVAVVFTTRDTSETVEEYKRRTQGSSGAAQRGMPKNHPGGQPRKSGGDARKGGDGHGGAGAGGGAQIPPMAKVHFMKKFVAALTTTPLNMQPATNYAPVLKKGVTLDCAGCHDPNEYNMEGMKRADPGAEAVDKYRENPNAMVPLMQNWVARLNKLHGDKLTHKVTCTSCHAIDPRDGAERIKVYAPLMTAFVNALRQEPTNKNAASNWKPLLKPAAGKSMLCANCHGRTGQVMEANLPSYPKERPAKYADNKAFMVHLMERWMKKANREMSELLVQPLKCLDCHESDPRR